MATAYFPTRMYISNPNPGLGSPAQRTAAQGSGTISAEKHRHLKD
jgi:hypothetical protein